MPGGAAVSLSYLKQLSARWDWPARAAAWQAELASAGAGSMADELEEIRQQQLRDARILRLLAREGLVAKHRQCSPGDRFLGAVRTASGRKRLR